VDLAYLSDEPTTADALKVLGRLCRRVEGVPVSRVWRWARAVRSLVVGRSLTAGLFESPSLRSLVGRWLGETAYDTVVCFSSAMLPYVLGRGLESRLIVDLVDVDSQKWRDYAERATGPKAALFRLEGRRVQALERAAGTARAVVLVTGAEAGLYRRFCPEAPIETIPNGVDLNYFRPMPETTEPLGCVFVGQLDYRANVLGLEWFCREAWPAFRAQRPEATFEIVGRNPTAAVRSLGVLPGVRVVGPVADVRPHLARASVVVAPLPVARGVQNKVLEALAMSRAVVASPAALEGLALVPGRDALVAASGDDWGRCLAALWDDLDRRNELGRNGRRFVETHHHWETCLGKFDPLIGLEVGTLPARKGVRTC
jgi:sugar transferase (PEP-CTERM/EpsH1 system associated)